MKFISFTLLILSTLTMVVSFDVFSPSFGQDLQRSIQAKIDRQMGRLNDQMETMRDNLDKQMEQTQRQVEEAVQKARDSVKDLPPGSNIRSSSMTSSGTNISTTCVNGVCTVCIDGDCTVVDKNKKE